MKIIITGSAGFIGYHLALSLLNDGFSVLGIDNLNSYYDPQLKKDRLKKILRTLIILNSKKLILQTKGI